jgi:hypothetical protein
VARLDTDKEIQMKKLILCVLLLAFPLHAADSPTPQHLGPKSRAFSDQDLTSIRAIASRYPCAILTLLHVMLTDSAPERGVLYIDDVPTPAALNSVLDDLRSGSVRALALELQSNLYSDRPTFTELRWSSSQTDAGASLLTFRAELKDRTVQPLTPPHVLEHPVTVVVSPNGVRLYDPVEPQVRAPVTGT